MTPLKIMLVDDDRTTLEILAAALELRGHEVIERDSSIGTALACSREKPDVLVLDVNMPGLMGNRLAQVVLGGPTRPPPLVVLHSSTDRAELMQLARLCGACGVIEKGADPDQFTHALEALVTQHSKARPAADASADDAGPGTSRRG